MLFMSPVGRFILAYYPGDKCHTELEVTINLFGEPKRIPSHQRVKAVLQFANLKNAKNPHTFLKSVNEAL